MAITFEEVDVDVREPEPAAAPAAPAAATAGPELDERIDQWLRLRQERAGRLSAD